MPESLQNAVDRLTAQRRGIVVITNNGLMPGQGGLRLGYMAYSFRLGRVKIYPDGLEAVLFKQPEPVQLEIPQVKIRFGEAPCPECTTICYTRETGEKVCRRCGTRFVAFTDHW